MKTPLYEIRQGLSGKRHFVLKALNGEIIGKSKSVKTPEEISALIVETQKCSQDLANYERKKSAAHQPFFNLWNSDKTVVLLTSEMYKRNDARENGIDAVIECAKTIVIKKQGDE